MRVALYKAIRPGIQGLFSHAVRAWFRGEYSHGELVFSDGMAGSSSWMDGGVRLKWIDFDPAHWDFFEFHADEQIARQWYVDHEGEKFDLRGMFGCALRPLGHERGRSFCSESIMEAAGYSEAWRFDPCTLGAFLKRGNFCEPCSS